MEQRERFVILACSDRYTIKELCEQFGVSRKTGHIRAENKLKERVEVDMEVKRIWEELNQL